VNVVPSGIGPSATHQVNAHSSLALRVLIASLTPEPTPPLSNPLTFGSDSMNSFRLHRCLLLRPHATRRDAPPFCVSALLVIWH
jgi:hypothetical protein